MLSKLKKNLNTTCNYGKQIKGCLNVIINIRMKSMDFDAPTLGGAVKAVLLPHLLCKSWNLGHFWMNLS